MRKDYEKLLCPYSPPEEQAEELANWEFIDTNIDFEPYINKYKDLWDLMQAIEEDYRDVANLEENKFLDGSIFNWMDEYEISLYIHSKYKINYEEVSHYERS